MINIKRIDWIYEPSYEGEVTLIDSHGKELICFTYDFPPEVIENKKDRIFAMTQTDLVRSYENHYFLQHINGFRYKIVGEVIRFRNEKKRLPVVKCFDYIIEVDTWLPGDMNIGEWVEFEVLRFDI